MLEFYLKISFSLITSVSTFRRSNIYFYLVKIEDFVYLIFLTINFEFEKPLYRWRKKRLNFIVLY